MKRLSVRTLAITAVFVSALAFAAQLVVASTVLTQQHRRGVFTISADDGQDLAVNASHIDWVDIKGTTVRVYMADRIEPMTITYGDLASCEATFARLVCAMRME